MAGALAIALRLASVLALVVLNGFVVSAEFALVSARRSRLDQRRYRWLTDPAERETRQCDTELG